MVDVVERKQNTCGGTIILKCKNFNIINLYIEGLEAFNNVADSVECLSSIDDVRLFYPFYFPVDFDVVENGWYAFQIEKEFSKIMMHSDSWRISYVNKGFFVSLFFSSNFLISISVNFFFLKVCSSYPEAVIVPKTISDESLATISEFRCLGRFPVLSYFHKSNKVTFFF